MTSAVLSAGLVGPEIVWGELVPLLILVGGACGLLLLGSLIRTWPRHGYAIFTVAIALATGIYGLVQWQRDSTVTGQLIMSDVLAVDRFSVLASILISVAVALGALLMDAYLQRDDSDAPELYALLLTSAIGGLVMVAANDLIVLFLGLEILSLSLYLMAASNRRREQSQEAGLKYFILGGFSSAFFLYGIAMIYGATGSTSLDAIALTLSSQVRVSGSDAMLLIGIGLLLIGLAFKVSAVPFQVWTPDVYEGAPSPVTAFMASAGKVAAFAALLRVLVTALERRVDDWRPAIWGLAVLTVIVGSVLAVVQTNVKRMLAYSSISHAGFILIGVEAAGHNAADGIASAMTYLVAYSMLVLGSFAVVMTIAGTGDASTNLSDFKGLGRRRPALALAFSALLLAQAGVPLTSGFVAKFGVIKAAVEAESYAIAIIAMVAAVIAAYLYLRIMISMWLEGDEDAGSDVQVPVGATIVVVASVAFTLIVGFFPGWLLNAAESVMVVAG